MTSGPCKLFLLPRQGWHHVVLAKPKAAEPSPASLGLRIGVWGLGVGGGSVGNGWAQEDCSIQILRESWGYGGEAEMEFKAATFRAISPKLISAP